MECDFKRKRTKISLIFYYFLLCSRECSSINMSLPALQKCEVNLLPNLKEIDIPSYLMSPETPFKFRISEKCATRLPHCMKPCPTSMTQLPISFKQILPQNNETEISYDDYIIPHHFTPKGYFRYGAEYFSPDDFCLYSHQNEQLTLKICPSKCASGSTEASTIPTSTLQDDYGDEVKQSTSSFEVCVPKCCSLHKVIDLSGGNEVSCQDTHKETPWAPLVYRSASRQICGEKRTNLKLHYVWTPPPCEEFDKYFMKVIPGTTRVRFRLLTDGTVLLRELADSSWTVLEEGTYCLDGVQNYGAQPELYTGNPMDQVLIVCGVNSAAKEEKNSTVDDKTIVRMASSENRLTVSGIAYVILLFSGVPFLSITAVIYVLVWNKQNVHGWTQFSHTLAVLLHYLAQAMANIVSRILNSDQNASTFCRIVGVANHFFVLASFCWLTVINYDLFSMFRHLKTTVGRSRGLKRFLVYMAIAWGLPFVVVLISVILDKLYGLYGDDGECEVDVTVPLYGHRTCYMSEDARPYYLFYPVGVIMIVNLILAGMTFVNMYKHDKSTRMATGERQTKHRGKFSILAKLFVVMGLVWIFEMFVWLFIKEGETLPWYLVFPDVFHFLQAIAIFILFACQPKILNQVAESYPSLKKLTETLKRVPCSNNAKKQIKSVLTPNTPSHVIHNVTNEAKNRKMDGNCKK